MVRLLLVVVILYGLSTSASAQPPDAPPADAVRRAAVQRRLLEQQLLLREVELQRPALVEDRIQGLVQAVRPLMSDAQFERLAFPQYGNASGARRQFDQILTNQITTIDRVCRLTETQKQKLRLAGHGDVKRFFDRFEQLKRRYQDAERNPQDFQRLNQDLGRLRTVLDGELFVEHSLLLKALPNTLDPEQLNRYEALARVRRATRHRANVEQALAWLGVARFYSEARRRALVSEIVEEIKPSPSAGTSEVYVILLKMGRLPEPKLRRWFGDSWEVAQQQLTHYQQLEPTLRENGLLLDDENGAALNQQRPR